MALETPNYPSLFYAFTAERSRNPGLLTLSNDFAKVTVDPLLGGALTGFVVDGQNIVVPADSDSRMSFPKIRFGVTQMRPFFGQYRGQQRTMGEAYAPQPRHGVGRFAIVERNQASDHVHIALTHTPAPTEYELFGAIKTWQTVELVRRKVEMGFFFQGLDSSGFPNTMEFGLHPYFPEPIRLLNGPPAFERTETGAAVTSIDNTAEALTFEHDGKTVSLQATPAPTRWVCWRGDSSFVCFEPVWSEIKFRPGETTDRFSLSIETS